MTGKAAIILAAGQGTRMHSGLSKVLHPVGGRAMVDWTIALARQVGCETIVVVCAPEQMALRNHIANTLGAGAVIMQDKPLGTGHAVCCAHKALCGFDGRVLVLYGDTPLVPEKAVNDLLDCLSTGARIALLGFEADVPGSYGRLIANSNGGIEAIVEAKEANRAQLECRLCNSGIMAASASDLFALVSQVTNDNTKGEYYLTDVVSLAREQGGTCVAVRCDEKDVLGVDTQEALARAESIFQDHERKRLLASGVTMIAPQTVFLSWDTKIESDVTVEPYVVCGLGVHVCSGARILAFSSLEGTRVGKHAQIGPYARLRSGTVVGENAKIGNFVETKQTRMGRGAKAAHLSYLGDADIGADANIGAGTVFCNYDGFLKHRTNVGERVFIGSNTSLVSPVSVGQGAYVGSGSVLTRDVAPNALALARATQVEKPDWAVAFRDRMAAIKTSMRKKN